MHIKGVLTIAHVCYQVDTMGGSLVNLSIHLAIQLTAAHTNVSEVMHRQQYLTHLHSLHYLVLLYQEPY